MAQKINVVLLQCTKVNVLLVVMRCSASALPGGCTTRNKRLAGRNAEVRTSRRWLTVIAAAGGLLIAGSPAIAAVPAAASTSSQATPAAGALLSAAPNLTGEICLTSGSGYCWSTNGNNAQLTIQASGGTDFYLTATSDNGWYKIHVANSSHCVEGEGGGNTAVIATDCAQGSINQRWGAAQYRGGCALENEASGLYATVYNDTNNKPIWESNGTTSGSYLAWSTNLWSGC